MPSLSKSTYLQGVQCQKLIWIRYNQKELIPKPDEAQQAIFDQGHEVGAWAKKLFPGGIEVGEGVVAVKGVAEATQKALPKRKPLFEPAFLTDICYARADVLSPSGDNEWDIVEVKSSTSPKDINLHDLAFQRHVYTQAGLKIKRAWLMHLNGEYVRKGAIDPKELFTKVDLTPEIEALTQSMGTRVGEFLGTISKSSTPDVRIGKHCNDPYPCPLYDHCWSFLPQHSVMDLYRGGQKAWTLLEQGITKLADIPDSVRLTEVQRFQREVLRTGKAHIDKAAIRSFLKQLQYPLSFVDFETFATAIPLFDNSRPYQQIPFQYSLHVVEEEGAEPKHFKFLARDQKDPRPEFMKRLREDLPRKGSIIVFNASFEKGRMRECCEVLPEFETWWSKAEGRIVDLLEPFRSFDYYHPDQQGSASIKSVLPVLTGKGYEGLGIQDGGTASRAFLNAVYGKAETADREKVFSDLDAYCGLDTLGMLRILQALKALP